MTNYSTGHNAEKVAAEYLKKHGYTVLELNWHHARAEIDIVARKRTRFGLGAQHITFFEVKYRKNAAHGLGLDYITPKKLQQMKFAAELWVTLHEYSGEYCLGAVELTGDVYQVTQVIEQL